MTTETRNQNKEPRGCEASELGCLVKRLRTIIDETPGCLCGVFESCEVCNTYSEYNKLRNRLIEEIDGPKPSPDYGAVFTIKRSEILSA
jgi:hypothetical protein